MKQVTLTGLTDPRLKIAAIKALCAASRPPGGEAMGLKAAKELVDSLDAGHASVTVYDLDPIKQSFTYIAEPTKTVDKDLVLEFVLDALAYSDPESAVRILNLSSYARLVEVLR